MVADLDRLSLPQIEGILDEYPWFALAQREFYIRMSLRGEEYRDATAPKVALYMRRRSDLPRAVEAARLRREEADKPHTARKAENAPGLSAGGYRRNVVIAGGDYFSAGELSSVDDGNVPTFARFSPDDQVTATVVDTARSNNLVAEDILYTETLAQIYANQGFSKQAIDIYSKLILLYPEKSAYFASLVKELKTKN